MTVLAMVSRPATQNNALNSFEVVHLFNFLTKKNPLRLNVGEGEMESDGIVNEAFLLWLLWVGPRERGISLLIRSILITIVHFAIPISPRCGP